MPRPSRYVHDDQLGWASRPGHVEPELTIDLAGLRMTGPTAPHVRTMAPVLAVGDSFTFGEEVSDQDTWPSKLQARTGRRVLNGGVSGYGLDQIVLRAENLTVLHKPEFVVLSFIADDVDRTEMRRLWWRNKPWFVTTSDGLVLKGIPVPHHSPPRIMRAVRRLERVLRALPPGAQHRLGYHVRVLPKGTGKLIAFGLIERLAALQQSSGARVLLVAEYDAHVWVESTMATLQRNLTGELLSHAVRCGLRTVDSFSLFASARKPRHLYRSWHMNEQGNGMIASLVSAALTA